MKINIKYFGSVSDSTSKQEEQFIIEKSNIDIGFLCARLELKYPDLKKINYTIASNKKIVTLSTLIKENDEIAILPPFSGG